MITKRVEASGRRVSAISAQTMRGHLCIREVLKRGQRGLEGRSERAGAYFSSDPRNLFRLLGCTWTTEEEGFMSEIQTFSPLVVFLGLVRTALHEWRETSKKRNIMETIIQMSIILM